MRTTLVPLTLSITALAPLVLIASEPPRAPAATDSSPMLALWITPVAEGASGGQGYFRRCDTYLRANHPDMPLRLQTSAFGSDDTVFWFAEYENLTARLQFAREERRDEGWQALMEQGGEFIDFEQSEFLYLFPLGDAPVDDAARPMRQLKHTRSRPFRTPEARRLAQQIVDHVEATYPAVDARAYSSDISDANAIYWIFDYENASTWESFRTRLLEDDTYIRLMASGDELFVEEVSNQFLFNI